MAGRSRRRSTVVAHVSGFPRSGTTLLQALLCTDPAAGPLLGEAFLPYRIATVLGEETAAWRDDSRYFYRSPAAMAARFARIIDDYVDGCAAMYNHPQKLVFKAPRVLDRFATLQLLRPRDRFVAIIRDPRDIFASMHAMHRRAGTAGQLDWGALAEELEHSYLTAHRQGVLVVRYEDLVTDPQAIAVQRRTVLGFRVDHEQLWKHCEFDLLASSASSQRHARSDGWGKPITADRVGAHQQLPRAARAAVVRGCARVMKRFRYT
jgi:Sulfotransferase family